MGVVRGADGRFYEIPDEELERYAVPDEKVKELLRQERQGASGDGRPTGSPAGHGPPPGMHGGPGGPVVIQVFTSGPPPGPQRGDVSAQDGWAAWAQQAYAPTHQIVIPPWWYHPGAGPG